MADVLKLEFGDDGIARIVMCNGEIRLRMSVVRAWDGVLDKVIGNNNVKALIITGEGKYFSNGIDLDWFTVQSERDMRAFVEALTGVITRLNELPVPTVALMNGHAFGAGAFLAIVCDYRVMQAERGWLCWPEIVLKLRFSEIFMNLLRGERVKMADVLKLEFGPDGIARIVMCNGENRLRMSVVRAWDGVLDKIIGNNNVKALIITGEGKYFCNGFDIDWFTVLSERDTRAFVEALTVVLTRLTELPVPTVALMNGHAFGAGAILAIACDYRVMRAERGWLCWPEVVLKLRFIEIFMHLIRKKIPVGPTQRDAILFGKRFTARAAQQHGLVDVVAGNSQLEAEGRQLLQNAIGRKGIDRDILHATKMDLYGKALPLSQL